MMVYSNVNNSVCETERGSHESVSNGLGKARRKAVGAVSEKARETGAWSAAPSEPPRVASRASGAGARRRAVAIDLRRKETRELGEVIVARAEFLLPDDRALVCAVFGEGMDSERVARLRGETARGVRRRVRKLAERVMSREFEVVAGHRDAWPRARRLVATACVLQGRTMREAARHLRMTLHEVRRQMDLVRALVDAEGAR